MSKEILIKRAYDSIIEMDQDMAVEVMDDAEKEGVTTIELLNDGFAKAMAELGNQFANGEVFLPELIFAAEIMQVVSERVDRELEEKGVAKEKKGSIVIATVEGDVHDIGKNICVSMLKAAGFDVYDMGNDVSVSDIIAKAEETGADIIAGSALLTTTMEEQKKMESILREKGMKNRFRTMIGGAPVTQAWADKIGADGYSDDAISCVAMAEKLINV